MPIASATLYVNSAAIADLTTLAAVAEEAVDVTTQVIAGQNIGYSMARAYTKKFFYLVLADSLGNTSRFALGEYRSDDLSIPVALVTLANDTSSASARTSKLIASWSFTDNSLQIGDGWLYISLSSGASLSNILEGGIKVNAADGSLQNKSGSYTFTGLQPATQYYVSAVCYDARGLVSSIVQTQKLTQPDNMAPTLSAYSITAGANAEVDVVISLTATDVVGYMP